MPDLFGDISDEEIYQEAISLPLHQQVARSIAWIRQYEASALEYSPIGYYLAFSGGKDSIVMERLFQMAGVKYQNWYNNVTIDPPELVHFIKRVYPSVQWNNPKMHLTQMMIEKPKGPPTRLNRWCCEVYKEQGGNGFFKAIGVRASESPRRKATWSYLTSHRRTNDPILCPIIYWTDKHIWEFIKDENMPYCSLYDEGFKRLGCVGCPMGGCKTMRKEFKRWPKYEALWYRGVKGHFDKWREIPRRDGKPRALMKFSSADELWEWWISGEAHVPYGDNCQSFLW